MFLLLLLPCWMVQSKNAPKSAHVYVASAYPEWKQQTLAHLRGCLEANGGEAFAPDVMKGLKVIDRALELRARIQGSGVDVT